MVIDIAPGPRGRGYARAQVDLHQLLHGRWRIYYQDKVIAETEKTEIARLTRTRRRGKGVPAAHDYHWVFMASAPPQDHSGDRIKPKHLTGLRETSRGHGFAATRLGQGDIFALHSRGHIAVAITGLLITA